LSGEFFIVANVRSKKPPLIFVTTKPHQSNEFCLLPRLESLDFFDDTPATESGARCRPTLRLARRAAPAALRKESGTIGLHFSARHLPSHSR
jgi:hypothetical protein